LFRLEFVPEFLINDQMPLPTLDQRTINLLNVIKGDLGSGQLECEVK